jgi:uncharacterized protein (TIGR02391 family)
MERGEQMNPLPIVDSNQLEEICKVLADTEDGLKGSEIGHLLNQLQITDTDPKIIKWRRLFNALVNKLNKEQNSNCIYNFILKAMEPIRFTGQNNRFEERRDALNRVIVFLGLSLEENGEFCGVSKANTLSEVDKRCNRLRKKLQDRNVHCDILFVCDKRFLQKDYFYAVFEAAKSVAEKLRIKSGLLSDGVTLVDESFRFPKNKGYPRLAINSLRTESEQSEHKGLMNLIKGLFGIFRNPIAHQPEHTWHISEQDALDLLTMASLIHRRLDKATRT